MRIRPATPADIPAMMALEKHAATAAHWSVEQYEAAFSSEAPSRVVLILEEEASMHGFYHRQGVGQRMGDREHRGCRAGDDAVDSARVCSENFSTWLEAEVRRPFSLRSASRTSRPEAVREVGVCRERPTQALLSRAGRGCHGLSAGLFLILHQEFVQLVGNY